MAERFRKLGSGRVLPAVLIIVAAILLPLFVVVLRNQNSFLGRAQVSNTFSFTAAGDFGGGSTADAVFNTIKNSGSDFTIAVGDFAYSSGTPAEWGANVQSILGASYPFELISGNHDDDIIDQFTAALPDKIGNVVGEYGKEYYFDYPISSPSARFILVSPDLVYGYPYATGDSHSTWVSNTIDSARAAGIPWIIVGMHKNCLTIGVKWCEIGEGLMNLLITKRVDLVLQGHDHNYQRTKQLTCATRDSFNSSCVANSTNNLIKGEGTVFLITGAGGNGLYDINASDSEVGYFAAWSGANSNPTWGPAKFIVSPDRIDGQFLRAAGGTFADSFSIVASGSPTPSPTSDLGISATPIPLTPTPPAGATTISKQIATGADDAEQSESGGSMDLGSSDLEFTMDGSTKQTLGMRFAGMAIPNGAIVTNAYIEFTADEQQPDATNLVIAAQAADNSTTFTSSSSNISSRPKTLTTVSWNNLPIWTVNQKYQTPNLASVVQEVVNRPGWVGGNAMVFIATGIGHRTADAYEGGSALAAKLVVSYTTDPNAPTPTPTNTPTPTPIQPTPVPTGISTSFTFLPVADSYVLSTSANSNFGSSTSVIIDGSPVTTTYMRFNLGSLAGKTIVSAKLRVRISNSSTSSQNIKSVSDILWGEGSLTYNNRPALGSVVATNNGGSSGSVKDIVLTSFVATKVGQVFSIGIDSTGSDGFNFYSKERSTASQRPILIVDTL